MTRAGSWVRKHAIATLVIIICGGFAVTAVVIIEEQDNRRQENCESFRTLQDVSKGLIDLVLEDPGGGSLPLTTVDSFQELPQSVQDWVWDFLGEAAAQAGDTTLLDRLAEFREDNLSDDNIPGYCH